MAKKKKSLVKRSINLDKELTKSIRRGAKQVIEQGLYEIINEFDFDSVMGTLELLKSEYTNCPGEYAFNFFDAEDFIGFVNYMMDLVIAYDNIDYNNIDKVLNNIKDRLVKNLGDKDIEVSALVATNRLFGKLECEYGSSVTGGSDILSKLGIFSMFFIVYVLTYTKGFKNKHFKEIKEDGNVLTIEYERLNLYDINSIKDSDKMVRECVYNLSLTCNKFYNNVYKGFEKACKWNVFNMSKDYGEYPFMNSEKDTYISLEEIKDISNRKLYLMPPGGVHFDFINKSSNVDCVELKEYGENLLCSITIFNKGGIYVHDNKSLYESERVLTDADRITELIKDMDLCSDEKIKINFRIPLEGVFNMNDIYDISGIIFPESVFFGTKDSPLWAEARKWIYCCLSCLYLAYCCPTRFQNDVRLYNIDRDSKEGFNRKSSYRTAYMRKLPDGQRTSEEAIRNAKIAGFNNIPQGYTFVSASNIEYLNEEKKKVIKIAD